MNQKKATDFKMPEPNSLTYLDWISRMSGFFSNSKSIKTIFSLYRRQELFQYVQKYCSVLECFNDHVKNKIYRIFSYRGQHIFFLANNRIKEKLEISQSTATRSINVLALIGLIVKIPHQSLPSQLLEISDRIWNHAWQKDM